MRLALTLLLLAASAPPAAEKASTPGAHLRLLPAPEYPDAAVLIADMAEQSKQAGRTLIVYVGAPWCEPCRYFHAAAEKGELDAAFPDLDLLVFNAEVDLERLKAAGYSSRYVPLFVVPGADGRSQGKQIEGSIKGDGAVAQITPRLRALLGR